MQSLGMVIVSVSNIFFYIYILFITYKIKNIDIYYKLSIEFWIFI